jgi:hypothetical protein
MAWELFKFRAIRNFSANQIAMLKRDLVKIDNLTKDAVVELDDYFRELPGQDAAARTKIHGFATDVIALAEKYEDVAGIRPMMLEAKTRAQSILNLIRLRKDVAMKQYFKGSMVLAPVRRVLVMFLARLLGVTQRLNTY